MMKKRRSNFAKDDIEAVKARERVLTMIDAIEPKELINAIKRAPSLRGMILGYIAEEMFEQHLPMTYPGILAEHIQKHDEHKRDKNKSDRTIHYQGNFCRIQLKSIQTNSICRDITSGKLRAIVQNDGSDARKILLPNGSKIITTCYLRGEYDVLAVPLFPFVGKWEYAYKLNTDCRASESPKYLPKDAKHLLATTEPITWPLSQNWHTNLLQVMGKLNSSKQSIVVVS